MAPILDGVVRQLGKRTIDFVRTAISNTVEEFLSEALQMQPH
jgi:hypothetical protein